MRRARSGRSGVLGWLQDVAGNATTETVIMIPAFVIIWGGIWYTHGRYRKAQNMAQFTRAHVWAYAYGGCRSRPAGRTTMAEAEVDSSGFIDGAQDLLFGSGVLPGFRFDEVEGRRSTSIERPAVLGEGTVRMRRNLVLMCNERTQGEQNFFEAAWDMFL